MPSVTLCRSGGVPPPFEADTLEAVPCSVPPLNYDYLPSRGGGMRAPSAVDALTASVYSFGFRTRLGTGFAAGPQNTLLHQFQGFVLMHGGSVDTKCSFHASTSGHCLAEIVTKGQRPFISLSCHDQARPVSDHTFWAAVILRFASSRTLTLLAGQVSARLTIPSPPRP